MTKDDISDITRLALSDRIRAAVKAVLEQVIEEEMTEHIGARHREKTDCRIGERNGSYQRSLITPVGKIEQMKVPRDREGRFMGTVYPPGDPVGYDCYVFDAYWGGKNNGSDGKFKQLWAWRKQNTWSGPVNVQAILKFWSDKSQTSFNVNTWYLPTGLSVAPETFGTSGSFRLDNVRIPDLNTLLPLPKSQPRAKP